MKLELNTMLLQAVLNKSVKAVSTKDLMPSLKNFVIKADKEKKLVTIIAGDGATYMIRDIPCNDIEKDGEVCVDARSLTKYVNKITEDSVIFEADTTNLLVKFGKKGKAKLKTIAVEDYIMPEDLKFDVENRPVDLAKLKQALRLCSITVSNNATEVYYTGYKVGEKVVSTNRNNLTCVDVNVADVDMLLTRDFVTLLYELDGNALISYSEGFVKCVAENTTIIGNLLTGLDQFPPNELLDSLEFASSLTINKKDLIPVLDRVLIFVESLGAVEFEFKEGIMTVKLVGNQDADTYEEISYVGDCNLTEPVRVNAGMLSNVLNAIEEDSFVLKLGETAEDPILVHSGTYKALMATMNVD